VAEAAALGNSEAYPISRQSGSRPPELPPRTRVRIGRDAADQGKGV